MLANLVLLIVCVIILVMLLLVIVVVGIRQEPATEELSEQAPRLIAVFVRRLLGLHVRKPALNYGQGHERPFLATHHPLRDPTHKTDPNER